LPPGVKLLIPRFAGLASAIARVFITPSYVRPPLAISLDFTGLWVFAKQTAEPLVTTVGGKELLHEFLVEVKVDVAIRPLPPLLPLAVLALFTLIPLLLLALEPLFLMSTTECRVILPLQPLDFSGLARDFGGDERREHAERLGGQA